MSNKFNDYEEDLKELSLYLGSNIDWVQGAGGNTSFKDNQNLLVKASGFWLSDAQNKNIFSKLNLKKLLELIDNEIEDLNSAQIINEGEQNFRPSIETTMHALMPHKFVAHVHSTNVISYAVMENSRNILDEKLSNVNWLFVPYSRPGLPLTKTLIKLNASNFDVLILENHGIVIGGKSKDEVIRLLLSVEKKLYRPIRKVPLLQDQKKLISLIKKTKYKLPKYTFCHSLANDNYSLEVLNKNPLYPDHIIFLGPGPIPIMHEDDFNIKLLASTGLTHKLIIIKNIGVIILEDLSTNAEEMLHCLTSVVFKIEVNAPLKHLSQKDEIELLGWDAETYRKTIER